MNAPPATPEPDARSATPAAPEADARLRRIRFVVFDFDGVFTDNTVLVLQDGSEAVTCWRGDGLGLERLQAAGVAVHVLSTERNPLVLARCAKLRLPVTNACRDKLPVLRQLAAAAGVALEDTAYVGNDVNDAECLAAVGLPIVVADAPRSLGPPEALRTERPGGRGAVREVCDRLLEARPESATGGPGTQAGPARGGKR